MSFKPIPSLSGDNADFIGDITVSGSVLGTGNGDRITNNGVPYLLSGDSPAETQNLDEVLAQGNTSSRDMQVETVTGFQFEATGEVGLYLSGPYAKIRSDGNIQLQTDDTHTRATFGSNYFYLNNNGANDVFRMVGGNAIIGSNTTPLAKLDVRGDITGEGDFLGTGAGNRITNDGIPYLLSGDSPAETQTLQDVCDNGDETTTSIFSTGPYISGVTGLFNKELHVGDLNYPDSHAFNFEKGDGAYDTNIVLKPFGNPAGFNSNYWMTISKQAYSGFITNGNYSDFYIGHKLNKTALKLEYDGGGVSTFSTSNTDINFEDGTLFVDESARRVGVGTTAPNVPFEIKGSVGSNLFGINTTTHGNFRIGPALANSRNAIKVSTDNSSLDLKFTSSSERIYFGGNGDDQKVGVNTASPSSSLEVVGHTISISTTGIVGKGFHLGDSYGALGLFGSSDVGTHYNPESITVSAANRSTTNSAYIDVYSRYGSTADSFGNIDLNAGYYSAGNMEGDISLYTSGQNRLIAKHDGNVGVGTTNPNSTFHVEGVISGSNSFLGTGDGNRITNNGVPYLLSGDSPAETQNLDQVLAQGNTSTRDMSVADISGSGLFLSGAGSAGPEISLQGAYTTWEIENQYAGGANNDMFRIRNTALADDALVINRGNNKVGIGTTNPTNDLHVVGTMQLDHNVSDAFKLRLNGGVGLALDYNSIRSTNAGTDIEVSAGRELIFHTYDGGFNEAMRIDTDGNVGIGTTSPDQLLHVEGKTQLGTMGYTEGGAIINYASLSETKGGAATLLGNAVYAGTTNNTYKKTKNDAGNFIRMTYNKGIGFHTNVTGNAGFEASIDDHEQMRLTTGGYLGIGTTNPVHPVDVVGNIKGDSFTIGTDTAYSNDLNITNAGKIRIGNAEFFSKSTNNLNIYQGRACVTTDGDFYVDTDTFYTDATNDRVGVNTDSPEAALHVYSGDAIIGRVGGGSPNSTLTVAGYDDFGLDFKAHGTWTHWKARVGHGRNFELYNDGSNNQNQVLELGKTTKNNAKVYVRSTGAFIEAGMNASTSIPVVSMGCLPDNNHLGGAYLDVRDAVASTHRYEFNRDGTFVASGVSVSGDVLGTGVGNRITNDGTPYLLSGDSPAETQTLQDVCDNGNETTTSIFSTGPYISGGTGLFEDVLAKGAFGIHGWQGDPDTHMKGFGDRIVFTAGGLTFADFSEGTQDLIHFNGNENQDIDFRVGYNGGASIFSRGSDGNVGIGTTAPITQLDVVGTGLFSSRVGIGTDAPTQPLEVVGNAMVDTLIVQDGSTAINRDGSVLRLYANAGTDISTWFGGYHKALSVRKGVSDALIGINNGSPSYQLDVNGTGYFANGVLGTGVGNRITNNGTPYLLSGDSPAETQTLQDVTTNGNTTTTSILSTGPHISGVTGLFSDKVGIGVSDPSYSLEVTGDIFLQGDNQQIFFGGANTFIGESSNSQRLKLRGGGSTSSDNVIIDNDAKMGFGTIPSYGLHLKTNPDIFFEGNIAQNDYLFDGGGENLTVFRDPDNTNRSYLSFDKDDTLYVSRNGPVDFIVNGTNQINTLIETDASENDVFFPDGKYGFGFHGVEPSALVHVSGDSFFDGSVGIGTASPSKELDVVGDIKVYNSYNAVNVGNQSNVATGNNSVAFGIDNLADGSSSIAIGKDNDSHGNRSIAIGIENDANVNDGVVVGQLNTVNADAVVVGRSNDVGEGADISIGQGNWVSGTQAVGVGVNNTVSGNYAQIFGRSNEGQFASVIYGMNNTSQSYNGILFGQNNNSSGDSQAFGKYNYVTGSESTAIGRDNVIDENYSLAAGWENKVYGSKSAAVGYRNVVSGSDSSALGHYAVVGTNDTIEIGQYNSSREREGAVRIHDNHLVAISMRSGTAPSASTANDGFESETSLASDMYTIQRNGPDYILYHNLGGSIETTTLGASEADTLQSVTTRGNETTTSIISTGPYISGVTGYYKDTLRVGDGGFVDFPSEYDTLQVGTSSNATNGHILVRGKESSITFKGVEGADKAHTIKEDAGTLTFYGDSTLSGTAGNARFAIQTGQSYFTETVGVQGNGVLPKFYLANVGGGASNKATYLYQYGSDFRIALNGSQHNGAIGTDAFAIKSTYEIGVGTTDPRAALHVDNSIAATTGFLVENSSNKNILWAEDNETVNVRSTFNVHHPTVASRYLKLGWGAIYANDNGNELTLGSNYSSNSATRIFVTAEGADNTPSDTIQMQANRGLAVFSGVSTDTFEPTALLDVRGDAFISGSVEGTGAGNRITNNGVPYLLSGDSPAETQTLQDVCDNGNTTTTSIGIGIASPNATLEVAGPAGKGSILIGSGIYPSYNAITLNGSTSQNDYNFISSSSDKSLYINRSSSKSIYFRENNSTQMIIEAGGNIGIGTASPSQKLDVQGTILVNNEIQLVDSNMRIFRSSNDLRLRTGGGDRVTINSSGKVGIGTTSPEANLHVYNDDSGQTATNVAGLFLENGGDSNSFYVFQTATSVGKSFSITNAGNVGIGTTSPQAELHIYGAGTSTLTIGTSQGFGRELTFLTTGGLPTISADNFLLIETSNSDTQIKLEGGGSTDNIQFVANELEQVRITTSGVGIGTTSPEAHLHIYSGNSGQTATNVQGLFLENNGSSNSYYAFQIATDVGKSFSITNAGNVGIGTVSPDHTLRVNGDARLGNLHIKTSDFGQGGTGKTIYADGAGSGVLGFISSTAFDFSNGLTSRLRIDSSGNVGIGTTSPSAKLDVAGSIITSGGIGGPALFEIYSQYTNRGRITLNSSTNGGANQISLLTDGNVRMVVDKEGQVGIGTTSPSNALDVVGHFSATSKSFLIDHPTKENKKLQYASLEGPENGVYVRGTTDKETIELPEYWSELVHEDSITVVLTPIGKKQDLFIIEKSNKLIKIGGAEGSFDYVVYGERKDIDKLEIEPLKV